MKLLGIAFSLNKLVLTFCAPLWLLNPLSHFLLVCVSLCALPQQLDYRTEEKLSINVTPPGVSVAFSYFIWVFMGFSSAQCDFKIQWETAMCSFKLALSNL